MSSQGAERCEVSDTSHLTGEIGGQTDAEPDSLEAIVGRILVSDHARVLSYLVGLLGNTEEARKVWQGFALRALAASGVLRDRAVVRGWLLRVSYRWLGHHFGLVPTMSQVRAGSPPSVLWSAPVHAQAKAAAGTSIHCKSGETPVPSIGSTGIEAA